MTIVKTEGRDSHTVRPCELQSGIALPVSVLRESGYLKPTVLCDMYSPPLSPHRATPSSDLELTPHPSPPITPRAHASVRVETNAHATDHDSILVTNTTSLQATSPIDLTAPKYEESYGFTTTESPHKLQSVHQEPVQNEQISDGSIALLVNISSRIDDLVKMVESVSVRVDLVETQMKTLHDVAAAQDHSISTDTRRVQKSVTSSSTIDTPHILQCKQSAHSHELVIDHTHTHTPLTHTPHYTHTSTFPSPPVSTPNVSASPNVFHSKQTAHSSFRTSQALSLHSTAPSTPVCRTCNVRVCSSFTPSPPGRGTSTNSQPAFQS